MMNRVAAAATLLMAVPAAADVVFSTAHEGRSGNCSFNTICGPFTGSPGAFAGQKFTLGQATSLTAASFTAVDFTNDPQAVTSVNWQLLFVDLDTGLPGALITSGNSALALRALNANQTGTVSGSYYDFHYSLPGTALAAGDYYLAFQAVVTVGDVYLSGAAAPATGAATFGRGGDPVWIAGYYNRNAVAISLSGDPIAGAVPEPASWAMLIAGFGLTGAAMRRRRRALAA